MNSLTFMILTGGRSTRYGSDKSKIIFNGTSLLLDLLTKLPLGKVVIVGPRFEQNIRDVDFIQEDPLGGGPVAAVGAGITLVEEDFFLLLATDLPFVSQIVPDLLQNLPSNIDALIPIDGRDHLQTLSGIYRTQSVRAALNEMGMLTGQSMKNLTGRLRIKRLVLDNKSTTKLLDIDTPDDLERALEILQGETRETREK